MSDSPTLLISETVRAFLDEPRFAVMATINKSGTPQLTVMWYALLEGRNVIVMNSSRDLLKERNLRRDPRLSLCIEDGQRYVTLEGRAELIEDRAQQEREVNELIAPRNIGQRLGSRRWDVIQDSNRVSIWMYVEGVHTRGI